MAEFTTTAGQAPVAPALAVAGDLDIAAADEFLDHAGALLETDAEAVDIDLGGVTFIDSSGLGALVHLHKQADAAGRHIRLTNVPRPVTRILELTGLSGLFPEGPEQ